MYTWWSARPWRPQRAGPCSGGLLGLLSAIAVSPWAAAGPVSDAQVDDLIDRLAAILQQRQIQHDALEIAGEIRVVATGERVPAAGVYRGTTVTRTGHKITFETVEGLRFDVDPGQVRRFEPAGAFTGEKTHLNSHGGRTALAVLALVSAGAGVHDPTVHGALQYLEHHPMPGTYGRALRASLYAHLVQRAPDDAQRAAMFDRLRRDARWLVLAMNDSGGYTYGTHADDPQRGEVLTYDNSNTQFGNLGVWIAALSGCAVPDGYWPRVEDFWIRQQDRQGAWGYRRESARSMNMTIAGINSLILVLDQRYARSAGTYRRYKGIPPNEPVQAEVNRLQQHIDRGRRWLAAHGRPVGEAYTQLGLERLGLAGGHKYIGAYDWYRLGAQAAMDITGWESLPIEQVSMWLLFLAHGRAPVLVNKLHWGGTDSGWDYYYRDLYHACRFLSNTYEQRYQWQIIDEQSEAADLEDAPILYIAGTAELRLQADIARRIQDYVNRGGTIVGHAHLGSRRFATSFRRTFEGLFAEWGGAFRKLPSTHDIYQPGAVAGASGAAVPLWGLSDGYRDAVILIPVDVAGAWQQSLITTCPDLFWLFVGLRSVAAGRYADLPGRLRPAAPPLPDASGRRVQVVRPLTVVDRGGAPRVWEVLDEWMRRTYDVGVQVRRDVRLANINELPDLDLVHVAGQGAGRFSAEELRAMTTFCRRGGLLLLEALGGDAEFAGGGLQQAREHFAALAPGSSEDALVQGAFPLGKPLGTLHMTPGDGVPATGRRPLTLLHGDGRTQVVLSEMDISVAANGHFARGRRGYDALSARKILRNMILYQLANQRGAAPP